jgi:thiamine pyrophosphate-dependent acetolactate synthase large subunit-like protein
VTDSARSTAALIVECLENEGVTHVFGIPGEENIGLVDAISRSSVRYVLARHEQGASFMAEVYGRLTGRAGVCSATLGPGAIKRLGLAFVILIWVDDAYGLISWKMDLEIGHNVDTSFGNPDFVAYAESFGATGYRITAPGDLLPTLRTALAADTVSVIACPVDYSANLELTESLGDLDESLS